jgi:Ca2+-binding EF-hand superfamily protein
LDCLDTERLAEVGDRQQQQLHQSRRAGASKQDLKQQQTAHWSVPLIHYKSFLSFCSRHCGHWADIAPKLTAELKEACSLVYNPLEALNELSELLSGLDEDNSGHLNVRSFLVACHRCRLLTNFSQENAAKLSQILATEHNGKVDYKSFLLFLRTNCIKRSKSASSTSGPDLLIQLLQNAMDSSNTLLPLRNWLIKHTDVNHNHVTEKELIAMLREFSVVFRPEEVTTLIATLRADETNPDFATGINKLTNHSRTHPSDALRLTAGNDTRAVNPRTNVDTRVLLASLMHLRGPWFNFQPRLADKMLKLLNICGQERFAPRRGADSVDDDQIKFANTRKGIETAAARLVLSRLRAFSHVKPINDAMVKATAAGGRDSNSSLAGAAGSVAGLLDESRMVERAVFVQVCRASGLRLTDQDVLLLADATDCDPQADRVRCDVIVEVLKSLDGIASGEDDYNDERGATRRLGSSTPAGDFALQHVRELLWATGQRLGRSAVEWRADVTALFAGFDAAGSGFITSEDFVSALRLLRCPVSLDILRDIPAVPDGPGLVAYQDILYVVLQPPGSNKKSRGEDDARDTRQTGTRTQSAAGGRSKSLSSSANRTSSSAQRDWEDEAKRQEDTAMAAVNAVLRVMRRSLHRFIVSVDDTEEAWLHMLRAFSRFDPTESNTVSARDFCLAISTLMDDDDLVLTQADWAAIIQHFAAGIPMGLSDKAAGVMPSVDYMGFCEAVLSPIELGKSLKTQESKNSKLKRTSNPLTATSAAAGSGIGRRSSTGTTGPSTTSTTTGRSSDKRERALHLVRNELNRYPSPAIGESKALDRPGSSKSSSGGGGVASQSSSALTTGQRSRMTATNRKFNSSNNAAADEADLRDMYANSASSYGKGGSQRYVETTMGKKIRSNTATSGKEYYAAWLKGDDNDDPGQRDEGTATRGHRALQDYYDDIDPRSDMGNTRSNRNREHQPEYPSRQQQPASRATGPLRAPSKTLIHGTDSSNTDFLDNELLLGRNKVRKHYKQSCKKMQMNLRDLNLTVQLQNSVKDLQLAVLSVAENLLHTNSAAAKGNTTAYELLEDRLRAEDRNNSGNLTIQSFYAALGSMGLPHARIFESPDQKKIVKLLEEFSGDKGKIMIGDFLALIFDTV